MGHISLNAQTNLRKFGLGHEILRIADSFNADTSFSSIDDKYRRYAFMYLKDFGSSTITPKQLLSNTDSEYYEYIDEFIEYKTYTNNILLSELIRVKDLYITNILLNKNIDIETKETNSAVYKSFDIFSFSNKPADVSFNVLSSSQYNGAIPLFEPPYKKISRYCDLGVRWSKKTDSFVAEICAGKLFGAMDADPTLIDIDYNVKLINNDALITVNVTEATIGNEVLCN